MQPKQSNQEGKFVFWQKRRKHSQLELRRRHSTEKSCQSIPSYESKRRELDRGLLELPRRRVSASFELRIPRGGTPELGPAVYFPPRHRLRLQPSSLELMGEKGRKWNCW